MAISIWHVSLLVIICLYIMFADTSAPEPVTSADRARRNRRLRVGIGIAAAVVLVGIDVAAGNLDAREQALFDAWWDLSAAGVLYLVSKLKHWLGKVIFAVLVIGSLGSVGAGVGLWHQECVDKTTKHGFNTFYFQYCLPYFGASPDFPREFN